MKKLFWQFSILVFGLALLGLYVKISGPSRPNSESFQKIPTVLWEGGEKTVNIHLEIGAPGKLQTHFVQRKPNGQPGHEIDAQEELSAGSHDFSIRVPLRTQAYFQITLIETGADATLNWQITYGDKTVHQYKGTLRDDSVDFPDITADDPKKSIL